MLRLALILLFFSAFIPVVRGQSPDKIKAGGVSATELREAVARIRATPPHGHARVKQSDLQLRLRNVLVDSNLLWFHLQLYNRSRIAFRPAYCRFTARDRRGAKRRALQSIELRPFRRPLLGVVRYRRPYDVVIPFFPFALVPTQQLVIEVGEAKSGRVLKLVLPAKAILHAAWLR